MSLLPVGLNDQVSHALVKGDVWSTLDCGSFGWQINTGAYATGFSHDGSVYSSDKAVYLM